MALELGRGYEVIEDGLGGRTTDTPDPTMPVAGIDGLAYLPACLAASLPLDLVVIMLGTNDLKAMFGRSPARIALGAGLLIDCVWRNCERAATIQRAAAVLLVVPPPLAPQTLFAGLFAGGEETSHQLAPAYRQIANAAGAAYFDAGSVIATDGSDGVHLTEASQRKLGQALATKVRELLD